MRASVGEVCVRVVGHDRSSARFAFWFCSIVRIFSVTHLTFLFLFYVFHRNAYCTHISLLLVKICSLAKDTQFWTSWMIPIRTIRNRHHPRKAKAIIKYEAVNSLPFAPLPIISKAFFRFKSLPLELEFFKKKKKNIKDALSIRRCG